MRLRFLFSIVLLFSGLISSSVFAQDYYYYFSASPQKHYSSPSDACSTWSSTAYYNSFYSVLASHETVIDNVLTFHCVGRFTNAAGNQSTTANSDYGHRAGDTCPANTVYNASTGVCDGPPPNKCEARKGETQKFTWKSTTDDPPGTVSFGGCQAVVSKARCSYISEGKAECTGTATFDGTDGAPAPNGNASECTADDCTAGEMKPESSAQACIYAADGSGAMSCVAVTSESKPGTSSCGTVNGAYTCIENPKATSQKGTLTSVKTEKTNPDGTVTVVTKDTLVTVTCKGRTCTSTTTTSENTVTKDSNGNTTGNHSTCTGPKCNNNGQTTTPGTGSGGGGGGGGGNDDGEEEGEGPSTTGLSAPEQGSFEGEGDKWDAKIEEAKLELKVSLAEIKDSFTPVGDLSLPSGGGQLYCPPPVSVLNAQFDLCLDKYAQSLSWIGSAIYAVFAIIALFIIFG